MLLRLQSVDSNHCQRDHLGKQRETWASSAPNLNRFVCSKQCAPTEVWVGCHQRRFSEECDWVSPCYEQGPDFHPTSRAVRCAFIFFYVCACVAFLLGKLLPLWFGFKGYKAREARNVRILLNPWWKAVIAAQFPSLILICVLINSMLSPKLCWLVYSFILF